MTLVFRCLVITPMFWPKVRAAKFYGELAYISDFMEAINAEFPPPLKVVLLTIAIKVRSISAGSLRGKKRGGGGNMNINVGIFQTDYVCAISMLSI